VSRVPIDGTAAPLRAQLTESARPEKVSLVEIVREHGRAFCQIRRPSAAQRAVLRDIARCRTAALGGHREQCESCGESRVLFRSCRNRHCPQCQSLPQARWRDAQQALLLPVPYFHVVFTLPHDLNALIRSNPKRLYALLFACVIATLREFSRDPRHLGAELGMTAVLHTWGQNLSQHVHLHLIVTGGGLDAAGDRWVASKSPRFLFPVRALSKLFRGKFLAMLSRLRERGKLRFAASCKPLEPDAAWNALVAKLRGTKWVVYAKPPFAGPGQVLDYLSRYTHRIAISNERILSLDNGTVRFSYKDYACGNSRKIMELPALEFLRRFLLHIVPRGFVRVRHYGILANCHRAEKLARCRELLGQNLISPSPPATETLADSVQRLLGIDISRCPHCGQGPLRIVELLPPKPNDTS